ncbi:MAG: secondary thiamine-phosphate synthase enzyme YjbQ [Anaerohalosphaera sp.]|nr:secondary thiamine-phosphate synthase enzyme YjbQ [Anaerohalosphaera sp.]
MSIVKETISVRSSKRCDMIDITRQVQDVVSASGIDNGDCLVFCKHTTGAITINENADPDVVHDVLMTLEELIPKDRRGYRHMEGNSDSHVKCSLVGCSEQVIIEGGMLELGTWQGIYFCEFDGPRNRQVVVQVRG